MLLWAPEGPAEPQPDNGCSCDPLKISIGIMAHNEEANIGSLLEALLKQRLSQKIISEIIVVSSGSVDSTEEIVQEYAEREPRIRLLVQPERCGKASAINFFLRHAESDILILQSADTLPLPDTIAELLKPFSDPAVGMSGGHPVPTGNLGSLLGFGVHCMWKCHHLRNIDNPDTPKLGELVAFRKIFPEIFEKTAVDEAEIESIVNRMGMKRVYCTDAILLNDGPTSLSEFFCQRKRVHLGNIDLARRSGYEPLRGSWAKILYWSVQEARLDIKKLGSVLLIGLCEAAGFCAAKLQMMTRTEAPYAWVMVRSGKQPHLARAELLPKGGRLAAPISTKS